MQRRLAVMRADRGLIGHRVYLFRQRKRVHIQLLIVFDDILASTRIILIVEIVGSPRGYRRPRGYRLVASNRLVALRRLKVLQLGKHVVLKVGVLQNGHLFRTGH